jgi:hypothetical protein
MRNLVWAICLLPWLSYSQVLYRDLNADDTVITNLPLTIVTVPYSLPSIGTVVISNSMNSAEFILQATGDVILSIAADLTDTDVVAAFALGIDPAGFTITVDTDTIEGWELVSDELLPDIYNDLIFRKAYGNNKFEVRR